MSVSTVPSAAVHPVELAPTDYGFLAHPLDFSTGEMRLHDAIMSQALGNAGVQGALGEFELWDDAQTREHGLRTGYLMAALSVKAVHDGLPIRDAVIGTEAALAHDVGKATYDIQAAIRSPLTFEQAPHLLHVVHGHPVESRRIMARYGLGQNHQTIAENHHGFQTERPAYGPGLPVEATAEPDGYIPRTEVLTVMLPVADTYDALSVPPQLSGRNYLAQAPIGHIRAMRSVSTLAVPAYYKNLIPQVVRQTA